MKKKGLIVFDIDGTLTDTVDIHHAAFRESLKLIDVPEFKGAFGIYEHHTDSHIVRKIFEHATKKTFEGSLMKKFEEHLEEKIRQCKIEEVKGAVQMIQKIEDQGTFGVCYATGSLLKPAVLKLEGIGIRFNPAQLVASNSMEEREKIVAEAIKNAGLYYGMEKFDRIISFGDGLWDLKTAENLAIEFIGIGEKNKKLLTDNGMRRHYNDFSNFNPKEL